MNAARDRRQLIREGRALIDGWSVGGPDFFDRALALRDVLAGLGEAESVARSTVPLTREIVQSQLESGAEPSPAPIKSQKEWDALFPGRWAQTPAGKVRIGENQYEKMVSRDREQFSGMVLPTLERPIFIFDDGNNGTVFVKSFQGESGIRTFVSVAVGMDDMNVVITNGPRKTAQIARRVLEAEGAGRLLSTRRSTSPPEGFDPPPRIPDNNRPDAGGLTPSLAPDAPESKAALDSAAPDRPALIAAGRALTARLDEDAATFFDDLLALRDIVVALGAPRDNHPARGPGRWS